MERLLTLTLDHLVTFFRIFVNLVASPRQAPARLKLFDAAGLEKGLAFFGVSIVLAVLVKVPFIPDGVDHYLYAALDGLWKIILIVSATAIARVAWFGCPGTFGEYLVANCYFFGVLSVLVPLAFVIFSQLPEGFVLTGYELVLSVAILVWCGFAWLSYGDRNGKSLGSSIGRLALFAVFLPPLALTATIIRAGTVVAKSGDDYAELEAPLMMVLSFGFYP